MTLPKPPTLLGAFEKTLFGAKDLLRPYEPFYDYFYAMTVNQDDVWMRFDVKCIDLQSTLNADAAHFSLHVVNYTNGVIDPTWTSGDFTTVNNAISGFIGAYVPYVWPEYRFEQINAYRMQFNPDYVVDPPNTPPADRHHPFLPSGPPQHTQPLGSPGSAAGTGQAPQVAATVTLLTPLRAHWGRVYLPFPASAEIGGDGQFTGPFCDTVAGAWHNMLSTLSAAEFYPVVAQTQHNRKADQALVQITGTQVDSNPDVIRRRRKFTTRYRKKLGT